MAVLGIIGKSIKNRIVGKILGIISSSLPIRFVFTILHAQNIIKLSQSDFSHMSITRSVVETLSRPNIGY